MAKDTTLPDGGVNTGAATASRPGALGIRTITTADLADAVVRGLDDFNAKPSHIIFLCLIYPVLGLILSRLTFGYEVLPLLFPMIAGFALLGPFAALGLYELSRRRELGLDVAWRHAFDVFQSASIRPILILGFGLLAIFIIWLYTARSIYLEIMGPAVPVSIWAFAEQVLTTPEGWALIAVGNGMGLIFAVVAMSISVVSFPLLLDRPVGVVTAVMTSIRAVRTNLRPMMLWGLFVACALVVGSLPFFIGLAIVMPVLGHSTWHLYRKLVEY